jgi:predicted ATPase
MAESISWTKELNDMHGLAVALQFAGFLGHFERDSAQVERCASDLIELATRQNFAHWLAVGAILRGWARSVCGDPAQGLSWIEDGVKDYLATGSILGSVYNLALKAEVLHRVDRTSQAVETLREAYVLTERTEARWWCAELHRLRGVFLASIGGGETEIESSLREAILTANRQKSASLAMRARATLAEYRRQKSGASGLQELRLPLS